MLRRPNNLVGKATQLDYDHRHYYDQMTHLKERIRTVRNKFIKMFGFTALLTLVSTKKLKQIEWVDDESDSKED
jgi:hypothetical protein